MKHKIAHICRQQHPDNLALPSNHYYSKTHLHSYTYKNTHKNNVLNNLQSINQFKQEFLCIPSSLTFVTVMQNQWVRSRPLSPSSKEQRCRSGRVMRRRGGQLC